MFFQKMLNVKLCSQRHVQNKSNIYDRGFFTSVKPYFENVRNLIDLQLGSIFYTTHPFMKKLTTVKTLGEKVFCYQWNNFYVEIRSYTIEWHHHKNNE